MPADHHTTATATTTAAENRRGPLSGIRVLDISTVYAAPITAMLLGLIGAGHADRVMLSHDSVCGFLSRPIEFPPEMAEGLANWNPTHIIKNILPRLRESGVSEATIRTITVENPRRYFEGA